MNVILISPHFPPNHANYAIALKRLGVNVFGIGDATHIDPRLSAALDDYYYVPDMTNYDDMLRAVAFFTFRHGKIDRIDSQNEFWLPVESRLREDFNIAGQKTWDTDRNRSKLSMKAICNANGIPTARGELVEDIFQLQKFAERVSYPIVLKPDIGVGASATYKLNSDDDCKKYLAMTSGKYLCEEFIAGTIVTFDGLLDDDGNLLFETSHEYSTGVMESVNDATSVYYFSHREIDPVLRDLGIRVLKAFNIRERFFHIEFFRTAPEKYVFLEINVRPPGLCSLDMMNYSADINLYEAWAAMLLGQRSFKNYDRKYSIGFAGRRAGVPHIHSHDDIMSHFSSHLIEAKEVPGAYRDAMGEFFYLVRHPNEERVVEMLKFILAT